MKIEFHHINFVSEDVERMHRFYTGILGLEDVPAENFPRPEATDDKGYGGEIRFAISLVSGSARSSIPMGSVHAT